MSALFRREWGAITFVVTVLIGALAVGLSLIVTGGTHGAAVAPPPPCPTFTPYVATPRPTATTAGHPAPAPTVAPATPFDPALANCPTAPLPPTSTPGPLGTPVAPPPRGVTRAPTLPPNPTPVG